MIDSGVPLAQPIRRAGSAGSGPSSARVQCEILPVACADGHIVALARHSAAAALTRELDAVFDPSTSVLHSTSWRYESEHLVLSYLAVLEPLVSAPPGFVLQPVDTTADRAGRTSDPAAIPVLDVLAHGLRHLAMLRVRDTMVAKALAGCWHELLAGWDPLPAGLLEHCLPAVRIVAVPATERMTR